MIIQEVVVLKEAADDLEAGRINMINGNVE